MEQIVKHCQIQPAMAQVGWRDVYENQTSTVLR